MGYLASRAMKKPTQQILGRLRDTLPAHARTGQTGRCPVSIFFAVFTLIPEWDWYRLPEKYLTSAYISRDSVSLESGLHSLLATGSHSLPVDDYNENPSGPPETAGQEEFLTVSYCRKG